MNLPDALAAVAAMDATSPLPWGDPIVNNARLEAEAACIAYVRTLAAQQGEAVFFIAPCDLANMSQCDAIYVSKTATEWETTPLYTHPRHALSVEEVNDRLAELMEAHEEFHAAAIEAGYDSLTDALNALRRLAAPSTYAEALAIAGDPSQRAASPVVVSEPVGAGDGELVRYINIYAPELCSMEQEEFVHRTYDQALMHINPGGQTIKFVANPSTNATAPAALVDDAKRMDWLEQVGAHGFHNIDSISSVRGRFNVRHTTLRAAIDEALARKGNGE